MHPIEWWQCSPCWWWHHNSQLSEQRIVKLNQRKEWPSKYSHTFGTFLAMVVLFNLNFYILILFYRSIAIIDPIHDLIQKHKENHFTANPTHKNGSHHTIEENHFHKIKFLWPNSVNWPTHVRPIQSELITKWASIVVVHCLTRFPRNIIRPVGRFHLPTIAPQLKGRS